MQYTSPRRQHFFQQCNNHLDAMFPGRSFQHIRTLEAGVVTGVEAADNADESEVRTHEAPEDDVPGEYLDKEE
jgi:hypothetical protein